MTALALPERATLPAFAQADVLAAFLAGRTPNTLRAYESDVADFAAWLGAPTASQGVDLFLSSTQGEANGAALMYRAALTEKGLKPATVARRLNALKALVKLARMLGRVSWSIDVEPPKVEAYRDTRGPGREGWLAMRRELEAEAALGDAKAIRDLAIVRLLHDLGLRRRSVVGLDLEDLDQERSTLMVLSKGRQEREEYTLPEPTARALAGWLAIRGTEPGPMFTRLDRAGAGLGRLTGEAVRLIVRDLGSEAGISRAVRPHGLRHQAITEALDKGHSVREVMKFARHASPATTMIYDDNRQDLGGMVARSIAGE